MGLGPSKCCKKPAKEGEKTPLRGDPERGRGGAKAGFSGRRADDRDGGDAREGVSLESPVDPDPGVFYAKPASKSSHSSDRSGRGGRKSRRRDRDKSRGRDERRDRDKDDTSSKRHHRRSNAEKVGEERILEYHREHPERAPLLGSSSEEEYDEEGHPVPKNWIGVCPARMQHRVWWWSVTFILCFILCAGVFLGFSHSFSWGNSDDAPHTPAPHAAGPRAPSSKFSHSLPSVDPSGVSDAAAAVSSVEEQLEEKTEELKEEVEELVPEPPLAVEWEREAAEEAKEKRSSKTSGASSSHASTGHEEKAEKPEKAEKVEKVEKPEKAKKAEKVEKVEEVEKPEKPEKPEKASSSKKSGSSALPFLASTGREEKASKASKASEASNHATSHATSRSKASRVASKPSTAGEPRTASAKKRADAADADAADDKEGAAKLFTISDDVDYDPFESLAENSFPKAPRRVGLGSR